MEAGPASSNGQDRPSLLQLRPGERLGKYVVERELGRGAMGVVYLAVQGGPGSFGLLAPAAEDKSGQRSVLRTASRETRGSLGRYVALKVCPPSANFGRVRREALAVARLAHPHILRVYDVEELPGFRILVFEYLSGGSLAHRLASEGPLPIPEALRIADEVASALEAAHRRGLIHQDVKPSNILFDGEGRAKLTDFGIALFAGGSAEPHSDGPEGPSLLKGAACYAAPEQWRGGPVDARTDLYALAVVLFQSLTGGLPFVGGSLEQLAGAVLSDPVPQFAQRAPQWPEMELETRSRFLVAGQQFFAQALAKVPEDRFSTARRFREGLRQLGAAAGVALPELVSPASVSEADLDLEMGDGLTAEAAALAPSAAGGGLDQGVLSSPEASEPWGEGSQEGSPARSAGQPLDRSSTEACPEDRGAPGQQGLGPSSPPMLTSTTVGLSFLVLDHVSWRGGFWERLRRIARAHLEGVLARVPGARDAGAGFRRRLALALVRLRVRTLERELAEVEARSRRLRRYGESEQERADAWQRRASRAVARGDEAGAQLAALRELAARDASRRCEERAENQEAEALVLRQVRAQTGRELEEAQRLWDLAVSGEAPGGGGGAGRTVWGRGGRWALRGLALVLVIWLAWALFAPTRISEPNGQGGRQALPSAFASWGMLAEAREDHTATVLPDGRVLVVGGRSARGQAVAVTEVCDPGDRGQVLLGPSLRVPRFNHTASLLGDGSVLVVGGEVEPQRSDALSSAERLVVVGGSEPAGSLAQARCRHAAVTLGDGSVLVVGGQDEAGHVLASVERYVTGEGRFEPGPPLGLARRDAAVALLADGSVLVAGGDDDAGEPLASLELLRPGASRWEDAGSLQEPRYEATVTALPDGRALVVGGGKSPRQRLNSMELFDPARQQSRVVGRLRQPRRVHTATLVTLAGEEVVLVVGGGGGSEAASSELIVPRARPKAGTRGTEESWEVGAGPRLRTPRGNHTATLLPAGARQPDAGGLLIIGGYDPVKETVLRSVEWLPGAPKGGAGAPR